MQAFTNVRLLTARLVLRPLSLGDAEQLLGIYSDPEFMRYWSSKPWTHIDQAIAMIENDERELAAGEHLRVGVYLRDQVSLIGTCSLFNLNEGCRRAELGYGIARRHWRQGYMVEAVGAVISFAFTELGLHRLEADIDPRNEGSARGLERLGFVREGLLRERWIVGDEITDSALYGLLDREWSPATRQGGAGRTTE